MSATMTAAQAAQQHNRTRDGRYAERLRGETYLEGVVEALPADFNALDWLCEQEPTLTLARTVERDGYPELGEAELEDLSVNGQPAGEELTEELSACSNIWFDRLAGIGQISYRTEDDKRGRFYTEQLLTVTAEDLHAWRSGIDTQATLPGLPAALPRPEHEHRPTSAEHDPGDRFGTSGHRWAETYTFAGRTRIPGTDLCRYDETVLEQIPEHLRPTEEVFADRGQYDAYLPWIPDEATREALADSRVRGMLAVSEYLAPTSPRESARDRIIASSLGLLPAVDGNTDEQERAWYVSKLTQINDATLVGAGAAVVTVKASTEFEDGSGQLRTANDATLYRLAAPAADLLPATLKLAEPRGTAITSKYGWYSAQACTGPDFAFSARWLAAWTPDADPFTGCDRIGTPPSYPARDAEDRERRAYWDRAVPNWETMS